MIHHLHNRRFFFGRRTPRISTNNVEAWVFALEDFGNGLTSFAYLKALPVDFVKIGGHYVRAVVDDPVYGTLVSAVNRIAAIMGIATIAEEVDSEAALEKLRILGIAFAQGNAVAPPEPLGDSEGSLAIPCYRRSA